MFVSNGYTTFLKVGILLASAVGIVLSVGYNAREAIERFEYPVLIVLGRARHDGDGFGQRPAVLYIGLELQSLSLYVVAAIRRDSVKSSEAGLKYFVLGALASGMLLFGASLVYGFSGTTAFARPRRPADRPRPHLRSAWSSAWSSSWSAWRSRCPPCRFHMWTPDVYEGAPTPVTAFFAAAPKLAAMGLLLSVLAGPFGGLVKQWKPDRHRSCHRLDGARRLRRDRPDQHQAPNGLQFDRPCRLRPGRAGVGDGRGLQRRTGLHGDLHRDDAGRLCRDPGHAAQRPDGGGDRRPDRPVAHQPGDGRP